MLKFLRLVKNEYIKLLLKLSTWIMVFIIIALCAVFSVGYYISVEHTQTSNDTESDYNSQISYLEESQPDGWELDVEKLKFLKDNEITPEDGWKYAAVNDMYSIDAVSDKDIKEHKDLIKNAVLENDWELYYQYKIDANSLIYLDNEEKEIYNWQYQYCIDNEIEPAPDNWRTDIISAMSNLKSDIYDYDKNPGGYKAEDKAGIDKSRDTLKTYEYRLSNDISFDVAEMSSEASYTSAQSGFTIWSLMDNGVQLVSTIGILVIVIAGGIVATEFSSGTIKFLLINPAKRWKILTSKYFTMLTFSIILLMLMYIIFAVMGMFLGSFEHLSAPYLYVNDGTVKEISGFVYMLKIYGLGCINVFVMATLAFAISSLIRSSALAIGISMFAMMGGSIINSILLFVLKVDWGRFLIFANTDLVSISKGQALYEGQTLGFASAVIAVHMIIFIITAWDGFVRREV